VKLRSLVHLYLFSKSQAHSIIERDIKRWADIYPLPGDMQSQPSEALRFLMFHWPEFRNVFYYRISRDPGRLFNLIRRLAMSFYPPLPLLVISSPDIGPGLFIQHGFATIIKARRVGANFWVNQQVTVGYAGADRYPTIGNNVRVAAGAKVLGEVNIGDNVTVGANAVVVKNVPPNCTVVGVPAYIIRRDGERVHEELV